MFTKEKKMADFGASKIFFKKSEMIYEKGSRPLFYYQIDKGRVAMQITNEDLRECIIKVFSGGESFGEPALICDMPYPTDAIADTDVTLWRMDYVSFLSLLRSNFDAHFNLTKLLSQRLFYKTELINELSCHDAEHRIMQIIKFYFENQSDGEGEYVFPFTRADLAKMTGLRVETVIRTVKDLEAKGNLTLKKNKIVVNKDSFPAEEPDFSL